MIRPEDREALVGQVAYLVDELHAQKAIVSFVPEPLWSAEPAGAHSLLELYGLLVALGERSYPGLVEAWGSDRSGAVSIDEVELLDSEAWNEAEPVDLIDRAVSARAAVVQGLESVEDWSGKRTIDGREMTLADVAFRITQEDAAILRRIGEQLQDADLGGSPVTRLS